MRGLLILTGILGLLMGAVMFVVGMNATDFQLGMGAMILLLSILCLGLASVLAHVRDGAGALKKLVAQQGQASQLVEVGEDPEAPSIYANPAPTAGG